ncbi:hypothetical protein KIH41_06365 [Litoribacter ruber]|uniref:hypothetical protein n=1 Tax=Litoribacter ruber TaxID=702568 RepID=UPI001BDA91DE|nr:hypothetical protein [Litoribacter ruber]MBT0810902.1 hypothetical protein [Litoribacter ruber]
MKNSTPTPIKIDKELLYWLKGLIIVTIIKKGTSKEEIKKRVDEVVSKSSKRDIWKYAGKLKIDIDPLEYQKKLRNEWT